MYRIIGLQRRVISLGFVIFVIYIVPHYNTEKIFNGKNNLKFWL
jgi:hypothetical protein